MSDWKLASSSTPAASSSTAQQQASLNPEPQPDICFPASPAANGSEQSNAAVNSNSIAQQAPLQKPHSNNTQANPVANVAQDVPHRVSPTEICQNGNHADGFVMKALQQTAATAAQPAVLEGMAACAAQIDAVGVMCGPNNKQKLKDFLQSIFDFQEVCMCDCTPIILTTTRQLDVHCCIKHHSLFSPLPSSATMYGRYARLGRQNHGRLSTS